MMNTPRVLAIHDVYTVGTKGLEVAMPVLSTLGAQVCPLPLTLNSNTPSYGEPVTTDVADTASSFMDAWQNQGFTYDAIYSGAIANKGHLAIVQDAINRFNTKENLVVIDPVLGDDGKRYDWLDDDMVLAMQGLVCDATVMTPNLTEACLISGIPYDQVAGVAMPTDMLQMGCAMLTDMGPEKVVVTDIATDEGKFKVISYDRKTNAFHEVSTDRISLTTYGVGDAFTSVLTGALLQGTTLGDATEKAATFVSTCLQYMVTNGLDGHNGLAIVPNLSHLR